MAPENQKNGWVSPGDDTELKKDLQKKYEWFLNVLYMVLLMCISGYFFINTILHIHLYGIDVLSIFKIIIFAILFVVGPFGLKGIYTEYTKFKKCRYLC